MIPADFTDYVDALELFELARMFVRFDHVASLIANANHCIGCNQPFPELRTELLRVD